MRAPDAASSPAGRGDLSAAQACKPWWQSRTLWLNASAAALLALESAWGVLQPIVPVNFYVLMAVLLPVANAMLRVLTSQGVRL